MHRVGFPIQEINKKHFYNQYIPQKYSSYTNDRNVNEEWGYKYSLSGILVR